VNGVGAPAASYGRLQVEDLKAMIDSGSPPRVIDIREAWETELAVIAGSEHLALSSVQDWWQGLDKDEAVVFYCHTGRRSESLCRALSAEGYHQVATLEGGIAAWSARVDPSVPRY
jgi:rhodanese-related sulfurtransferase